MLYITHCCDGVACGGETSAFALLGAFALESTGGLSKPDIVDLPALGLVEFPL